MLNLIWIELETLTAQISRLQAERFSAKVKEDQNLAAALAAELAHAVSTRDSLVARIGEHVGDVGEASLPAPVWASRMVS